jgi:type II secretory pathway pseudopilin PulG
MPVGITAAPGPGAAEAAPGDRLRASRGFILVMLLAFITTMGIFLTVAMPNVATEVQRDQEAELIFRGEAISSAIKLYKAKTGGYPLNLEDLTKVKPRILRRLYQDPMTRDGEWDLITAVQPGSSGDKAGLPIVGVRSHCQKDSFAVYRGKTLISDWTFSAADNLLGVPGADNPAAAALLDSATGKSAPKPGEDPSSLGAPAKSSSPAPADPGSATGINAPAASGSN